MKNHHPKKRFGQHFLRDEGVLQQIVTAISPTPSDHMVEIGPGLGVLTACLLPHVKQLDVIELDNDLIRPLQIRFRDSKALVIHHQDALSFDLTALSSERQHSLRLVGNLPYQISTPLLFHCLAHAPVIVDLHFMLQKEVVDRLAAHPNTKAYGRLSVMTQYHCAVEALFDVPPQAFDPPPAVWSSVVRLTPRAPITIAHDFTVLDHLVRQAFNQRRKTLSNSLKGWVTKDQWESVGIDPHRRAENLSVAEFVDLANVVSR